MNEKVAQKIIGVLFILLSVLVAILTKDGTISLILIPVGLFLITTEDVFIVQAYSADDDYDDDYDEEDEEEGVEEDEERHIG